MALILVITAFILTACGEAKNDQALQPVVSESAQSVIDAAPDRAGLVAQQYVSEVELIGIQLGQKLDAAGQALYVNPEITLEDAFSAIEDAAYALTAVTPPAEVADLHAQRVQLWQSYGSELDGDSFATADEFRARNQQVAQQDAQLAADIDNVIDKD